MNVLGRIYCRVRDWIRPEESTERKRHENEFLAQLNAGSVPEANALLEKVLRHASEHIPYYRDAMGGPLRGADARLDLARWPVLTKTLIREHFEALKAPDLQRREYWQHASGGSTGRAVHVIHDEFFAARAEAMRKFAATTFYGGPYLNQLVLWGGNDTVQSEGARSLKRRVKDWLREKMGIRTTLINTFDLSQDKLADATATVVRQKPQHIFGYAGSVYQLAKYMKQQGIAVARRPRVVQITAQTCYPFMRELIEEVFQCQICDHWGSREVGPVCWEDAEGDLCICDQFTFVEVVDDEDRPVAAGKEGRILVTTLHNFAMPLIRYDIGDRAVVGASKMVGGRCYPTLKKILGKVTEDFIGSRGQLVHGMAFIRLFYFRDWVDEFQVIQKRVGLVQINYVPAGPEVTADIVEIETRVRQLLGEGCRVRWTQVSEIPKTPAGKRLYIRCEVKPEERQEYAA